MRHFNCHKCGALVFTEKEDATRCANCLIREQTDIPRENHKQTKMVPFPKYPHPERDEDFAY